MPTRRARRPDVIRANGSNVIKIDLFIPWKGCVEPFCAVPMKCTALLGRTRICAYRPRVRPRNHAHGGQVLVKIASVWIRVGKTRPCGAIPSRIVSIWFNFD